MYLYLLLLVDVMYVMLALFNAYCHSSMLCAVLECIPTTNGEDTEGVMDRVSGL